MSSPFRLRVHGRSGPRVDAGDRRQRARQGRAADRAARRATGPEPRLEPGGERACSRPSPAASSRPAEALELARAIDPAAAELLEPLLSLTVSPTMISASEQAQRDPDALRGDGRLPAPARPDAGRGRAGAARGARRGRLRARVARGPRRHALASSGRRSGTRSRAASPRSSPRRGCAGLRRRLHRQPLAARGVRDGRVRLLPDCGRWTRSWRRG